MLVVNFVVIPLVFIGYLLTIASSIPGEIKVGFCIAALCAGMPFAPILAQLAQGGCRHRHHAVGGPDRRDYHRPPDGLPLAIDAVDAQLMTSAWDVAWPLLVFLLLPLVLGCGFRVWWPDLTPSLAKWVVRVAILCLLFNVNFTLVAYWESVRPGVGHRRATSRPGRPIHRPGVRLPSRLRSSSSRISGVRHAAEITTAVRNIAPMLLMMIFPFGADPLVTVSITILNTVGITVILLFVLMWRRAAPESDPDVTTQNGSSPVSPAV